MLDIETLTDERIKVIEADINEIKMTLDFIKTTLVNADQTITKVSAEVMPTLNQVMESPMLRMLTGGKKK